MGEEHIEFTLSVCVCSFVRLYVPESCPTHYFIVHCRIQKLFGTNDYQDKTRAMSLSQRSRSQMALKVCTF